MLDARSAGRIVSQVFAPLPHIIVQFSYPHIYNTGVEISIAPQSSLCKVEIRRLPLEYVNQMQHVTVMLLIISLLMLLTEDSKKLQMRNYRQSLNTSRITIMPIPVMFFFFQIYKYRYILKLIVNYFR